MLTLLLLACTSGSPDDAPCATGGTGTLQLDLDLPGEDWSTVPEVEVYGTDGSWVATAESSTTLDLPGGAYVVVARRGVVDGSPVGQAYGLLDETVQQVCVGDGVVTSWAGSWIEQPSSGKLWALSRESAYAFDPGALAAGGDVLPGLSLDVPRSNDLRGLAFDATGNLWVATAPTYGARLLVYPPGGVDGSVEPVELSLDGFGEWAQVMGLAFGPKDDLWVLVKETYGGFVGLWGFSPWSALGYLATGEAPAAPDASLVVTGLEAPEGLVVGPDDRLWIADMASDGVYSVSVGSAGGGEQALDPDDAFLAGWEDRTGSHALTGPTGLAFDDDGRLWVNYWTNPALARFDVPHDAGAERVPDLVVEGDALDLPASLATDHAGRAWYGNEPQDGAGELIALDVETGAELSRARSADALSPTTLVLDPR